MITLENIPKLKIDTWKCIMSGNKFQRNEIIASL